MNLKPFKSRLHRNRSRLPSSSAGLGRRKPAKVARRNARPDFQRASGGSGKPVRSKRSPRRISNRWLHEPAVKIYRDGREVCNPLTQEGRYEYEMRKVQMWVRQDRWCSSAPPGERHKLHFGELTFEHEFGRTKARQDDRLYDDKGRPINGVSCVEHNDRRGSRRTPIFHGEDLHPFTVVIELKGDAA